jgi:hypothetical protein
MNYPELIPVLIQTLKQQQHQLDDLKQQLAGLEAPNNFLVPQN